MFICCLIKIVYWNYEKKKKFRLKLDFDLGERDKIENNGRLNEKIKKMNKETRKKLFGKKKFF